MTTLIEAVNDVHNDDDNNNNKNIYSNIMMIYTISCCWLPVVTALVSKQMCCEDWEPLLFALEYKTSTESRQSTSKNLCLYQVNYVN